MHRPLPASKLLWEKSNRRGARSSIESSGDKRTVRDKKTTTIALLGGDSVVGQALSLLLRGVGYETRTLDAPPSGLPEDLLEGVDLLLISPGLVNGRREESLTALRGARERMGVPVLELPSVLREGLLDDEVGVVPWPINIDGLSCEIEGALEAAAQEIQSALGAAEPPLAEGEPGA